MYATASFFRPRSAPEPWSMGRSTRAGPGDSFDRVRSNESPGPARVERPIDQGSGADLGRKKEAVAYISLPPAEDGDVDGDHDRPVPGRGRPDEHRAHPA